MRTILLTLFLSFLYGLVSAQIQGKVTDNDGTPLPYVNIFIKNSSVGTTSNFDGNYALKVNEGSHTIVYQYIGFKTVEKNINLGSDVILMNVQMENASYEMPQITISADAEDPAYAIIRNAQAKRKEYLDQSSEYVCDAYVRGFNKIYNAPEKIMGIEVGDMDGALDSTRQGVVYLSESVSKLYVSGSKSKEVMFSSKVSGDDQGYSFNSAQEMEFVFYNNTLELNRKLISPIASMAMSYYKYKLIGASLDENGQLVNKILVEPKNDFGPCFRGYIYINEDLWNINSVELYATKEAIQLPFIDSLSFKQIYIPVEKDRWMMLSNVIQFEMKAFGFEVGGNFACVYSNYELDSVDPEVFNREVYVVESEANTRTETYWDSIRPIPLSMEEELDYIEKDSIRIVRESPEYLDSVDREQNKFKAGDIIGGYSHRNSQKKSSWSIGSPLFNTQVNTIQGWHSSITLNYNKSYNESETRRLNVRLEGNYSFATSRFRPQASISYRANRHNNLRFSLTGGQRVSQFNKNDPITDGLNSIMTLFFRRNYLKAYDNNFIRADFSRDLGAVFAVRSSIEYEDRSPLTNNYDGSIFYKDSRNFTPNIAIENHQAFIFRLSLRIKPGERIVRYPDRTFKVGSSWPTLWLHYKRAIKNVAGSDTDFELLHASINKNYSLGTKGDLNIYIHGGTFLNSPDFFVDNVHFLGNQTHIAYTGTYNYSFLMLPYYDFSTNDDFLQWHIQHSFDGYILGKIPLIRRLNWHLVGGYKQLLKTGDDYLEWHIGLDNIGYKLFRLFRVDAVWAKRLLDIEQPTVDEGFNFGVVVGLKVKI